MSPLLDRRPPVNASRPSAEPRLCSAGSVARMTLRLGLALAVGWSLPASAQNSSAEPDSSTAPREGWIVGPSIGMPTTGRWVSPEAITIGLNFTRLSPGHLGADISFGTMPRVLAAGIVAFGFRADAAYPVSVSPSMLLLPAAGVSVVGVGGDGGGGGALGANAGLAAVFHGKSPTGLRVGITAHQFLMAVEPIFLIEVGVVNVPRLEP